MFRERSVVLLRLTLDPGRAGFDGIPWRLTHHGMRGSWVAVGAGADSRLTPLVLAIALLRLALDVPED